MRFWFPITTKLRVIRAVPAAATVALVASSGLACSPPEQPSKYPPQKPGCEIQIFNDNPSYQTDNIGPVSASCDESISDEECLRTLKDQACKLGADTVWGVNDPPTKEYGKKKYFGRAAHQK